MKKQNNIKKYVGVDLHTNRFTVFYITENERYSEEYELHELDKFIENLDKNTFIAVEASCNTFMFNDKVKPHVADLTIVNPYKIRLISMVNKKTDKVDAEKLAMFIKTQHLGGEELIEPVYVPDQKIRDLRSLFATYKHIRKLITLEKNRIHALLKQNMILVKTSLVSSKSGRESILAMTHSNNLKFQFKTLFSQLELTEEHLKEIEKEILKFGHVFYDIIEKLISVKGISVFTALAIIADVGDIKRFKSAKKLTSYLRSAPAVESSNEVTRIKKTNKHGRKLTIELLIQASTHFRNFHPKLNAFYHNAAKSKGKIRMAICRKIIAQIYHIWKNMECHHYCEKNNHEQKIAEYNRFIAKYLNAA